MRRDLSRPDVLDVASSELDYVISTKRKAREDNSNLVSVDEAMKQSRVTSVSNNRDVTRVLFISKNSELLNPTTQSLDGYTNISDLFDEVHIVILRTGITPKNPVLRVAKNVWLYTASSRLWWKTPMAGIEMIEDQLEFANGFRPDLVVALDPFESAIVANKIGEKYNKPTQLHILEDYNTGDFVKRDKHNFWRLFLPFFTVKKFLSVRTITGAIQAKIQKDFTIPDVDTLPRFQNYEKLINHESSIDLKQKYQPFIFFMLYVGKLGHDSTLYRTIDATHKVLRNARVALMVVGDGPARKEFEKRAKILGVEKNIIFVGDVPDVISYINSAHMLLVSDTDFDSEDLVLKGASLGVPMVMSRTDRREDIFTHGESAYLFDPSDTQAYTGYVNELMNSVGLRSEFSRNGVEIIHSLFHHSFQEYREAYRASIEKALFVSDEIEEG